MQGTPPVAERLRVLRAQRGLHRREVAKAISIKESTLASYEIGRTEPGATALLRLAEFYRVSCDYLLGRSDHPLGIDPGRWIIDLDSVESRKGQWATEIPLRYDIVARDEKERIKREGVK